MKRLWEYRIGSEEEAEKSRQHTWRILCHILWYNNDQAKPQSQESNEQEKHGVGSNEAQEKNGIKDSFWTAEKSEDSVITGSSLWKKITVNIKLYKKLTHNLKTEIFA